MPELLKDERKVVNRNGNFVFILNQEQEYVPEARENMLKEWKKELKEKQMWLEKFSEVLEQAKAQTESELVVMKEKIEKDIVNIKEGIETWTSVHEEE